jgi:hypothetical protein
MSITLKSALNVVVVTATTVATSSAYAADRRIVVPTEDVITFLVCVFKIMVCVVGS